MAAIFTLRIMQFGGRRVKPGRSYGHAGTENVPWLRSMKHVCDATSDKHSKADHRSESQSQLVAFHLSVALYSFTNKSSAVAEMAAQSCTSRIFAFEWG